MQLPYKMKRVNCLQCGVKVEQVPWAIGNHSLPKAHILHVAHVAHVAHWARRLSWKETTLSFRTTWDQACHALEYVVQWDWSIASWVPFVPSA